MKSHHSIKTPPDSARGPALSDWLQQLSEILQTSHQRGLLWCQGSRGWCLEMADTARLFGQQRVLSDLQDLADAIPFSKADSLLGQEADCAVFDIYSGLNIDALCMAAGLVRAGGVILVLAPQDDQQLADRYGEWQGLRNQQGFFRKYLIAGFERSDAVYQLEQNDSLPPIRPAADAAMTSLEGKASHQQAEMLETLSGWLKETGKPLFILTADRGRGKSTTLGMFATSQAAHGPLVVSAPSRAQAAILLQQVDHAVRAAVSFIAPDEIIRRGVRIDLLIIDEAAMLPYSVLRQCQALAVKTILATTTAGYEGTGQGFLLKFLAAFDQQGYRHHQLQDPIRWGRQDQLEILLNDLLWLKPELEPVVVDADDIELQVYTKQQLSQDIPRLKSIYTLLISAHYRTRPSDLRQLMEDENQRVIVAGSGDRVAGVLLLNREGGFDPDLSVEVFFGRRRPQGHLFAQMLTAQAGIRHFAEYRGYRIQRITVNPGCRRQGIGARLIKHGQQMVRDERLDYLGCSFALDIALAPFWRKLNFELVHIGSGQGKSTGRQTVALIKPVKPRLGSDVELLRQKLVQYLPSWLVTYCRRMYWPDVLALLQLARIRYHLGALDQEDIRAFSQGHRGFDLSQGSLQKLLISCLPEMTGLSDQQQALLIEKVLLNRDWQALSPPATVGRRQLQQQLRQIILQCHEYWNKHAEL